MASSPSKVPHTRCFGVWRDGPDLCLRVIAAYRDQYRPGRRLYFRHPGPGAVPHRSHQFDYRDEQRLSDGTDVRRVRRRLLPSPTCRRLCALRNSQRGIAATDGRPSTASGRPAGTHPDRRALNSTVRPSSEILTIGDRVPSLGWRASTTVCRTSMARSRLGVRW